MFLNVLLRGIDNGSYITLSYFFSYDINGGRDCTLQFNWITAEGRYKMLFNSTDLSEEEKFKLLFNITSK